VKILALTHRLPWAPNRGDRIRAYHLLHALRGHHDVHLLSLVHDDEEQSHVRDVRAWLSGVSVVRVHRARNLAAVAVALTTSTPLTFALLNAPALGPQLHELVARVAPDVIFAYCSGMGRLLTDPVVSALPSIIDMVDMDSAKWRALGATTRGPLGWVYGREARVLSRAEAAQMRHARATTVVNDREAQTARALAPDADIRVVQNGVDVARFAPPGGPAAAKQVVFCGVMSYQPNAETAHWLAERVWPLVRARHADARLALVGSDPSVGLRKLEASDASVVVTGHVADVRPWLWESAVGTAPIRTARGIQNKVLEAIAAGLPCVISRAVAEGLPAEVAPACDVVDDAESCANRICGLLALTPDERRARARTAALDRLGWEARLQPMVELFAEFDETRRRSASAS
jgi:sugar transferase (PEP-CTERM/EpsH1 system associated)